MSFGNVSYICSGHPCKVRSAAVKDIEVRKLIKVRHELMDGTVIISLDVVTLK